MAFALNDWVRDTSTTEGTDDFVLAGAVAPYRGFADVLADGAITHYTAYFDGDFESGLGTYDAGTTTLARTRVDESSNGDAKVVWGAGTKIIECSPIASRMITRDTPKDRFLATKTAPQNASTGDKITFSTVVDNIGSRYDSANARVVPAAGRSMLLRASVEHGTAAGTQVLVHIYKNGSVFRTVAPPSANDTDGATTPIDAIVTGNGTDFYEVNITFTGGGSFTVTNTASRSYFEGIEI